MKCKLLPTDCCPWLCAADVDGSESLAVEGSAYATARLFMQSRVELAWTTNPAKYTDQEATFLLLVPHLLLHLLLYAAIHSQMRLAALPSQGAVAAGLRCGLQMLSGLYRHLLQFTPGRLTFLRSPSIAVFLQRARTVPAAGFVLITSRTMLPSAHRMLLPGATSRARFL